jgi:hypothetical protein
MVFKSVGVSRPGGTVTCVGGTRGCLLSKIHPAYIPRILRPVRAPADDSVAPWSSSPSPDLFPATRPRPVLSQTPPPNPIAAEPDGRRVLSGGGVADHEVTPKAPLTGSGCREYSYGGFGGGHPHFLLHAPDLQIRRSGRIVQDRPLWAVRWADIPELSVRVRGCLVAWQQYWQQSLRPCLLRCSSGPVTHSRRRRRGRAPTSDHHSWWSE